MQQSSESSCDWYDGHTQAVAMAMGFQQDGNFCVLSTTVAVRSIYT